MKKIWNILRVGLLLSLTLLTSSCFEDFFESEEEYYFKMKHVHGEWVPTKNSISRWLKNTEADYHLTLREDGTFSARVPGPMLPLWNYNPETSERSPATPEWSSVYSYEGNYYMTIQGAPSALEKGDIVKLWGKISEGNSTELGTGLDLKTSERSYIKGKKRRFRPKKGEDFDLIFFIGDPDSNDIFAFERKIESSEKIKTTPNNNSTLEKQSKSPE
ncbi:MAG: hypothetical protein M0Q48_01060 [Verrucomicrobia bacterium]|jgi:hypothetical protein|nr:hypothetical protein [Verrucomicrobiota bacterium]